MKMVSMILTLFVVSFWSQPLSGQQSDSARLEQTTINERAELRVPVRSMAGEINRLERLTNHLGGSVMRRGNLSGVYEIIVRIPNTNAAYFRDRFAVTTPISPPAASSETTVFQVLLVPSG